MQVFQDYVHNLDIEAKISLHRYTVFCKRSNDLIFNRKKLVGADKYYYNQILDIFLKGPKLNETITLYRGMKTNSCKDFSGFISTSYDKDSALKFIDETKKCCVFIITVPAGDYTILPIENISQFPEEKEVLLPPGTLNITGSSPNGDIYCVYIPDFSKSFKVFELEGTVYKSVSEWIDDIESDLRTQLDFIKNKYDVEEEEYETKLKAIEDYENEMIEALKTLSYYNEIPSEVFLHFLSNKNIEDLYTGKHEEYKFYVLLHDHNEKDIQEIWKEDYTEVKPILDYIKFLLENSDILYKNILIKYLFVFPAITQEFLPSYYSYITKKIKKLYPFNESKVKTILQKLESRISKFNCKFYEEIFYELVEKDSDMVDVMKVYNIMNDCKHHFEKDTEFKEKLQSYLNHYDSKFSINTDYKTDYHSLWIPYYQGMMQNN